ncbi:hypothetical protein ABPG77_006905 [Micractinium sp. CCAP 211/92]
MHYLLDWSHLPGPALQAVLAQLGLALACDEPLYVFHAKVPAPNKYWAQACKEFLELDVWCGSSLAELQALLQLAARVRLRSCTFKQPFDQVTAAARTSELLAHPGFEQLAGRALRALTGAPATLHCGSQQLHPFPLASYPGLEALQLYVPPHQQVWSLREACWSAAHNLQRLSICGRHYVALRVLPPRLQRLEVSAWHVLAEPQVLVRCRDVLLLAAAVLLTEQVLPYGGLAGAAGEAAARAQLCELAQLLAAAGLPRGHCIHLQSNLVCFRRGSDGADAKLISPAAGPAAVPAGAAGAGLEAAAAEQAADGADGGAAGVPAEAGPAAWQADAGSQAAATPAGCSSAFPPLAVRAGGVHAVLRPAPAGAAWPAALGPNPPPGAGPGMEVVLHCAAAGY